MSQPLTTLPPLLTQAECRRLLGGVRPVSVTTWHRWRARPGFPKPVNGLPGHPRFRRSEILKLLGEGILS